MRIIWTIIIVALIAVTVFFVSQEKPDPTDVTIKETTENKETQVREKEIDSLLENKTLDEDFSDIEQMTQEINETTFESDLDLLINE